MDAAAEASFASLPHALALAVLARVPADTRLRCREVCRAWRDALDDASAWWRLDMRGVEPPHATLPLLRAAAARAHGQLRSLDVSGAALLTHPMLLGLLEQHAGALRELRVCSGTFLSAEHHVLALLRAAPHLHALHAHVRCLNVRTAIALLRNEPPFAAVRVAQLHVNFSGDGSDDAASMPAFATAVAAHASLEGVSVLSAPLHLPAALDAFVDAALARRLRRISFFACKLDAQAAPALARLLGGGALTELCITYGPLLDAPAATLLGNALRANRTLASLSLIRAQLWHDAAAGATLLGALVGHPSLKQLNFRDNAVGTSTAVATDALFALVAAPASVDAGVRELDIQGSALGRDVLDALLAAAARSSQTLQLHV
jgi:hypothetical protein